MGGGVYGEESSMAGGLFSKDSYGILVVDGVLAF